MSIKNKSSFEIVFKSIQGNAAGCFSLEFM